MGTGETMEKRVRRGLAWIIRRGHKYDLDLSRVNLATLDLGDDGACLLAQAGGNYYQDVLDSIQEATLDDDGPGEWAERHGFVAELNEGELTAAWKVAITKLRTGPVQPATTATAPPATVASLLAAMARTVDSYPKDRHPELHAIRILAQATGARLNDYVAAILDNHQGELRAQPAARPSAPVNKPTVTITPDQVLNGLDRVISSFSRTEHPELHRIRDLAVSTGPRLRTYATAIAKHYQDQLARS